MARNRVKRAIREWFRHHRAELPKRDFVVIARREATALTPGALAAELSRQFEIPEDREAVE